MKSTPFSLMATKFRGQIVKSWSLLQAGTQTEKAAVLTAAAIRLGFITRTRPVPGAALADWATSVDGTPFWAAQTALMLMLETGWVPESNLDWCGMAAILFKTNKMNQLEQLIDLLPERIDKRIASGWLTAAIEEDAHFRAARRSK
jgi:hypothetical protein